MLLIYNVLIVLVVSLLKFFALFNSKLKLGIKGRENWQEQINKIPKEKEIFWFHCASLGEFDQGLPVMNLLKQRNPNCQLVVTFFSPSGFEHYNKRKNDVDFAIYLPFDTQYNSKQFLELLNPKMGFLVKYEFWPNLLNQAAIKQIPLISISTVLRPNQIYFKWYGFLFRNTLKSVRYFFVQNKVTSDLLNQIGLTNHQIVGDTRFDRVIENKAFFESNKSKSTEFQTIERFLSGTKAIIFGSSWKQEEEILSEFLLKNMGDKIILAPHDVSASNIERISIKFGKKAIRLSKFEVDFDSQQVLILDSIGHLASAYSYGKVAFVGGGFSGSLHNILEPAVFGLPVIFGPNHSKFPEADAFIQAGIGFEIRNIREFEEKYVEIESQFELLSTKTADFVERQKGASKKIIDRSFSR
jgi:3-deoxy-D-manno-octulosonic-acid transferase